MIPIIATGEGSDLMLLFFSSQKLGVTIPNFTASHLEGKDVDAEEEDTVKWAAASLYSGGADTVGRSMVHPRPALLTVWPIA